MRHDEFVRRLVVAGDRLATLCRALQDGGPWPLATRFDHVPEASWGPRETLAHVEEMLPYWLGEVARILAGPPEPVPFGRVGTDPVRIAIIGRDRTLPIDELCSRIDHGIARWKDRLQTLTPAQVERIGLHPSLGEMSIEAIIERQVVAHVEDHVHQLEAILRVDQAPG